MVKRSYSGVAPATTLNGAISAVDTELLVAAGTGYPTGAVGPFVICLDAGLATEEKILVEDRATNTLTVAVDGRGYDGTSAVEHADGAPVTHVWAAQDATDAAEHIDAADNVHGVGSGSDVVGTATEQVLTNKTLDTADNDITVAMGDVTGLAEAFTDAADDVAAGYQAKRSLVLAGRSGTTTIPDNTLTKIACNATLVESAAGLHDPVTNNTRLYTDQDGWHRFEWSVPLEDVGNSAQAVPVSVYVNGSAVFSGNGDYLPALTKVLVSGHVHLDLEDGDYVEFAIAYNNDSGPVTVGTLTTLRLEQVVA